MVTRREFLDTLAVGAAGLAIRSTAKSYGQILGSNDRVNFAIIGLHGEATLISPHSRQTRTPPVSRIFATSTATS